MTLMKGYVGSGILAMPYAFYSGGWLLSSIILLISVSLLIKGVWMLIEVAGHFNKENAGLIFIFLKLLENSRLGRLS